MEDNLTQHHTLLLNKFPVKKNHVLIVTKKRQKQTDLINQNDFEAILITMKAMKESFMFYNSGEKAGASQQHKHFQVMDLEYVPSKELPIDKIVMDTMQRADQSTQATNILSSGRSIKKETQDQETGIKTENGLILGNMDRF